MSNEWGFLHVVGVVAFVVCFIAFVTYSYADDDKEVEVLKHRGYTEVVIEGWDPMGCSDSDVTAKRFTAKEKGQTVEGTICCGVMKRCTIRW